MVKIYARMIIIGWMSFVDKTKSIHLAVHTILFRTMLSIYFCIRPSMFLSLMIKLTNKLRHSSSLPIKYGEHL